LLPRILFKEALDLTQKKTISKAPMLESAQTLARKRKREEETNEHPLRSYRIPKTYKLPAILEVMESGNVNLYCEVNCIRISKDLLVKGAILFVSCKYRSENAKPGQSILTNQEPYFITVEKSDLLKGLKDINGGEVSFIMINIFEDHLSVRSYNGDWKEVASSRVSATISTDEPILNDPGEEIKYPRSLKISGTYFLDRIPTAGKQLHLDFETDTNRLRLTASADGGGLETSKFIYVPNTIISKKDDDKKEETNDGVLVKEEQEEQEDNTEYRDIFGENATKLLKKIIELFKDKFMVVKFLFGFPIHVSGSFEKIETIKFYMAGKIQDDDDE
jgi:hypothetical protein